MDTYTYIVLIPTGVLGAILQTSIVQYYVLSGDLCYNSTHEL